MALREPELLAGRRAFPVTQRLFYGLAVRRLPSQVTVGWHGTSVDENEGAFAVVGRSSGLADLVGERLRVFDSEHEVFVYVIGVRDIPTTISVARRAFMALRFLAVESCVCTVEVVE